MIPGNCRLPKKSNPQSGGQRRQNRNKLRNAIKDSLQGDHQDRTRDEKQRRVPRVHFDKSAWQSLHARRISVFLWPCIPLPPSGTASCLSGVSTERSGAWKQTVGLCPVDRFTAPGLLHSGERRNEAKREAVDRYK